MLIFLCIGRFSNLLFWKQIRERIILATNNSKSKLCQKQTAIFLTVMPLVIKQLIMELHFHSDKVESVQS